MNKKQQLMFNIIRKLGAVLMDEQSLPQSDEHTWCPQIMFKGQVCFINKEGMMFMRKK